MDRLGHVLGSVLAALAALMRFLADRLDRAGARRAPSERTMLALRRRYPDAPDHWLQTLAERAPHLAAPETAFEADAAYGLEEGPVDEAARRPARGPVGERAGRSRSSRPAPLRWLFPRRNLPSRTSAPEPGRKPRSSPRFPATHRRPPAPATAWGDAALQPSRVPEPRREDGARTVRSRPADRWPLPPAARVDAAPDGPDPFSPPPVALPVWPELPHRPRADPQFPRDGHANGHAAMAFDVPGRSSVAPPRRARSMDARWPSLPDADPEATALPWRPASDLAAEQGSNRWSA
ncbi:hypothetical protein ABIC65_003202 [Sphingomonas trueperi]|uniref:hypothetical protein n=1 Tax=Sphingomonas trueperi TaxID=53317 RepID=UPI003399F9B6